MRLVVRDSTQADYHPPSLKAFQRRFIDAVMEGDRHYYSKVAALLREAQVPLEMLILTDLCRASFVQINGASDDGDKGESSASESVLTDNPQRFAAYVDAGAH